MKYDNDKLLALLDVGKSPVSLALKPDGGELAAFNFEAGRFRSSRLLATKFRAAI